MASTLSFKRALILALVLLFAVAATFVVKSKLDKGDTFEFHDNTRAADEIDKSYVLLIADSEQNFVENTVKDHR